MHTNLKKGQQTRESGQTLILFTLFIIMLILFVGLGIDLGFAYITRARLSKSVDAACLTGLRNYSTTKVPEATAIADSTFHANYGTSGRDVGGTAPTPVITFGSLNNNVTLDVSATTKINTFFIRVLPALFPAGASWQTLTVGSSAQATRPNLIMSLVLDRSGSMGPNGGMAALKTTVPVFVDHFDDGRDRVSMNTFACNARTDVSMVKPFKAPINTAVNLLKPDGWTGSEPGLELGRLQNLNAAASVVAGEKIIKVIVFFTDGLANTWQYTFDCGLRNIAPGRELLDPSPTNSVCVDEASGCSVPATIPSIDGVNNVVTTDDCQLQAEAEKRAQYVAKQARLQGNVIYAIGLGDPAGPQECGRPPINPTFLQKVANDPNYPATFDSDPNQTHGIALIADSANQISAVFEAIARDILGRLTK